MTENLIQKNQCIVPSYSLYGGYSGFQTYGVLGTKVKNKLISFWRKCFVDGNDIVEIETPTIMPYEILDKSGHVKQFTDYVVRDQDGNVHRADHVVKKYLEANGMGNMVDKVSGWNQHQLAAIISKYNILGANDKSIMVSVGGEQVSLRSVVKKYFNKSRMTGMANQVAGWTNYQLEEAVRRHRIIPNYQPQKKTQVDTINLMYAVPANSMHNKMKIDFLRPELAQGIFVNFNRVKKYLKKEPPFGIAQVGRSYRKEISTKPYTRLRSFTQAEIEYFFDPHNNTHQLVDTDILLPIYGIKEQTSGEIVMMSVTDLAKLLKNNILVNFIVKTYKFAIDIGLKEHKMRFRQHLPQELAHYSSDCWDLETFVLGEWLECVGIANRGAYDLKCHSHHTPLVAYRNVAPVRTNTLQIKVNKKVVAMRYKSLTPKIVEYFKTYNTKSQSDIQKTKDSIKSGSIYISVEENGNLLMCVITPDMIEFVNNVQIKDKEAYFPHVIEPSFGIDRIMFSIFDHCYWTREEKDTRNVLSIPNIIAPYHIAIFPLFNRQNLVSMADKIRDSLSKYTWCTCFVDTSNTNIGKKYVRADEIGVQYVITVDPGSLTDNKVTIRDRDSMKQVREEIDKLETFLNKII